MLNKDELREHADVLDQFHDWAGGMVEIAVTLTADEYYFDLGAFGEQYTYVEMNDDYHPVDVEEILDKGPLDGPTAGEIAGILREIADAPDPGEQTLDEVLGRMQASGTDDEKRLADCLIAVADVLRGFVPPGAPVPLPATPAPWPGALHDDVDYTAVDFPFRYLPPPGFVWQTAGGLDTMDPASAIQLNVSDIGNMTMVLDDKGRVRYGERADGDYSNGARWRLWHRPHDEIPEGRGFSPETPPRALDALGRIIVEPHTEGTRFGEPNFNWDDEVVAERMSALLGARKSAADSPPPADDEVREEFAPPAPVSI